MTRTDILEELGKLPADERLGIVETALHQLREQFRAGRSDTADALETAYETDSELTASTTLCIDEYRQNG